MPTSDLRSSQRERGRAGTLPAARARVQPLHAILDAGQLVTQEVTVLHLLLGEKGRFAQREARRVPVPSYTGRAEAARRRLGSHEPRRTPVDRAPGCWRFRWRCCWR